MQSEKVPDHFPSGVAEKVGAYVYALRDPRTEKIFYIGKGQGDRVFQHALGLVEIEGVSKKNDVILDIINSGLRVEAFILQHGLGDSDVLEKSHAHQTESALYGLLNLLDSNLDNELFGLTNIVAPPTYRDYGLRSVADVIAQYGEPADLALVPHNSMFIKPTRTWYLGMPSTDLYEYTRGWWRMNFERAQGIRFVLSVPKFIVRAIYEIPVGNWRLREEGDHGWIDNALEDLRVGFDGVDVSHKFPNLINRSVEHAYNAGQGKRSDFKYMDDIAMKQFAQKGIEPWWNTPSRESITVPD